MTLFQRLQKSKSVFYLIELLIVFAGVYLAFLLSSYHEAQRNKTEKNRILSALKYELEEFRIFMPLQASYMENKLDERDRQAKNDTIASFYSWRYLEPQYNYQIVEYALGKQDPEIISLQLYTELSFLYSSIRHLEQAERRMTNFADMYVHLPSSLAKESELYQFNRAKNVFTFYKFRASANDRANNLSELSKKAVQVLKLINQQFTPAELKEIEEGLILMFFTKMKADSIENTKEIVIKNFGNFTQQEIESLFQQALKEREIDFE